VGRRRGGAPCRGGGAGRRDRAAPRLAPRRAHRASRRERAHGVSHREPVACPATRAVVAFLEVGYSASSFQSASTRRLTAASMAIGRPHVRCVSAGHLLVASMPILLPSPATGEAKSR